MKNFALNFLLTAFVAAVGIAAYDRWVIRPAQLIGVVNAAEVFRAKEEQFLKRLSASGTEEDRRQIIAQAKEFAELFPVALAQLEQDCACLVIDKSAVIGMRQNVVDLTPLLRKKVKL